MDKQIAVVAPRGIVRLPQAVVFASYGNDSIALIQWASEHLPRWGDVYVLYSDTGWAADWWPARVERAEAWVASLGFIPSRTQSIGLEALVKHKKAWPRQGMQFCTEHLKILPAQKWLDENDPLGFATCMVGVRREESRMRSVFPEYVENSPAHGGRPLHAPLVDVTEAQRNSYIESAGFDVLPHRSKECFPCINENRSGLRALADAPDRVAEVARIEAELGFTGKGKPRTMFRPYRHMGATGIEEIVRWAAAEHGEFDPDDGTGGGNCDSGHCGM